MTESGKYNGKYNGKDNGRENGKKDSKKDGLKKNGLKGESLNEGGREPGVKEYLSVQEVADQAGQSYGTVKRAIDGGSLPAYRIGRKFFISREAAAAYCQGRVLRPEGYTLRELMTKLSLSYAYVSRLVRSGQLKSRKVGRQYIVSEADFEDFMLRNRF